ncbi:hypothetical protein F66182_8251 [Fusarium sp. NRRL 66182]|nr:hypothetical protein F66182_8251 [Fusarium sp. NRRL 66182]
MLPLLQTPPHAVTPQSNLDTLTAYPNNDAFSFDNHRSRILTSQYEQAFAIRTSQPQRHDAAFGSTLHQLRQEHHLRRKTPNGTIDAGYDGSPSLFSHGPPPAKHLILPRSATATTFPPTGPSIHQSHFPTTIDHLRPSSTGNTGLGDENQPTPLRSSSWAFGSNTASNYGASFGYPYGSFRAEGQYFPQGQPEMLGVFPSAYQPLIRAHEYNPGVIPSRYIQRRDLRPMQQHAVSEIAHRSTFAPASEFQLQYDSGFNPNTFMLPYSRPTHMSNQPGFREKVLLQAHKSYVELLAYAQTVRKSAAKGNMGHNMSPRLLMYPKPPKPSLRVSETLLNHQSARLKVSAETCFNQDYHPRRHTAPFQMPFNNYSSADNLTPIAAAKSSLDMLSSLCEQSSWGWVDGMMLGGCLHYGLEQYQEALEWFSRITALDSSHVEAITNKAATLYCLNRQEEAEKQWIKAIEVQPSYLEAAEHLVGLLYKKRSKDAVEIIEHVQRTLRVSLAQHQRFGLQGQVMKAPGFASSGYAIPGNENGRILALIHAKGTMLYSLKEVNRASEAFEEAVLISVGRQINGIQDLVRRVQTVLSPTEAHSMSSGQVGHGARPLLLPPERARHTAHLVFGSSGALPGLRYVADGSTKRAAVQTTSNSLLSLAKIFQDALSSGQGIPNILQHPSGVGDILALYYLSLSLQESPSTANNVGILLAGVQQTASNPPIASVDMLSQPHIPGIMPGSGLALALAYYHYGLRLDPKHVHLHTNLGSLLKDIGQLDLAIQMYEKAVSCDGTFDIALTNLANAVKDRGRINDAITYYKRAVNSNPDFAEAVCGLSTALNSVCDWRGRGGAMLQCGKYDRWHVDDDGLLIDARSSGRESGLVNRVVRIISRQLDEASHWGRGVLDDKHIAAFAGQIQSLGLTASFQLDKALENWSDKPWEGSRIIRLIERTTRATQWKWYRDRYVYGNEAGTPYPRLRLPPGLTIEREAPVFRDVSSWPADKLVEQIVSDEIHILVNLNGYTRGARNEIFAARPAPIQMSFMGFAGTLGAEWCDYILADSTAIPPETLRPWRENNKITDIFYDETEGGEEGWMYSENIIFCRDTFFCCDHAQSCDAGERLITWEQEQKRRWKMRKELFPTLTDDTIIMGNFNQLYKIEPTTFRTWLRILAQVPKAVIWLLRFPELGEANLRRTAKAWAGEEVAGRLIFTDVAPKGQHISRARICDLFLDTPECNAHTTAADVLWSSTPLLTLPRYPYKMCSRMAASILKGALPKSEDGQRAAAELIAKNEEDYEQRAVQLASGLSYTMSGSGYGQGDGRLVDIRKLLWESKWHCGLFDTKRWVNDVETAYEEAWRRWVAGASGDIYL